MGCLKKSRQQSLNRASSCQCLKRSSGSHRRARLPNIFWKLIFLLCHQLGHWESSISATLRREKFEQTLQGKDQPTVAPITMILSAALHALCLPSVFLISFHHKQICSFLFHLLGFLPYASFICPAKQQQYGTYFPSPWLWDEPVTWCFSRDDGSKKKNIKGQNFGGKWDLWRDDAEDIEPARRIYLFHLIMPTHFRLSVYNVVANTGTETPCCDARWYKIEKTFASFAVISVQRDHAAQTDLKHP